MKTLVLSKMDVPGLVEALGETARLIGPRKKEHQFVFGQITKPEQLALEYPTTILPPSRQLFPNDEPLVRLRLDDVAASREIVEGEKTILLGVHPCDVQGINILDEVFSDSPPDANYLTRRSQTIIIALECQAPCSPYNLCFDKGTYRLEWGYDLLMIDLGDRYFVFTRTGAGEELIGDLPFFRAATPADREALGRARETQAGSFKTRLAGPVNRLPNALKEAYDDLLWEAVGRRCLSCETCTNVCPTCYCFDVADEVELDLVNGTRCRQWDSCQSCTFAEVAGGENFRPRPSERQRHRLFKKEVYQYEKYGRSACVGCGRCSAQCVASIRLNEMYNQVLGG
ncbi:MAG: Ni/Fe hydrogenase subunit beta [Candidatus Eisenbacteria bacterium]|nr:Ni/Fe hydrogenase subunit beta [Candidatus Latescibacterota bacterium]MBD3301037.1 Ni/Fe hydrogenase subunit beta [Candidatus Eisenbacteria bacterium]